MSSTTLSCPTYGSLRRSDRPRLNPACRRLFWQLQAPFSTAVFVLNEQRDPDGPREAYFRQTLAGTTWHPVAHLPLTEPKVSSVTVRVGALEDWEDEWLEAHGHASPYLDGCVYGALDGVDPDDNELLECCGTKRPKSIPRLIVSAWEKPYVTVHDYITALHPWLLSLRNDILTANNVFEGEPLPATTKLFVSVDSPDQVTVDAEECWFGTMRGFNTTAKSMLALGNTEYVSSTSVRRASVVT